MLELLLFVFNVFLLIVLVYREEMNKQERKDLLRMIKAETLDEVTRAEIADKQEETVEELPEFVEIENTSDQAFDKAIQEDGTGQTN